MKNTYYGKTINKTMAWGKVAQAGPVIYEIVAMLSTAVLGRRVWTRRNTITLGCVYTAF